MTVSSGSQEAIRLERAVEDHPQRSIFGVVGGNKEDGAPEIRIEHVRVSHQQRTCQAQRHSIPEIAHDKLECASSGGASAFGLCPG